MNIIRMTLISIIILSATLIFAYASQANNQVSIKQEIKKKKDFLKMCILICTDMSRENGLRTNFRNGIDYFNKAIKEHKSLEKDPEILYRIGLAYYLGDHTLNPDKEKGIKYFNIAKKYGSEDAINALKEIKSEE